MNIEEYLKILCLLAVIPIVFVIWAVVISEIITIYQRIKRGY